MEAQMRSIEHELKHLEGEELQSRLETYNRLQSEFDARNGYACESEITGVLKGLGFTEDDFNKQTDTLSGGQKTRVSLGKLLLTSPDILLLDEPTNHLDLNSIAWLETYLINYSGAVFIVSHDRYFINQTATRIMDLTNQAIVNYIGDYDYYLEKKDEMTRIYAPAQETAAQEVKENVSETKLTWQQQKEEQALKRKRENELKKVEARIEELEARDKEIDETMVLPDICTNVAECTKLSREKAAIAEELEGLYERWEELA